LDLPFAEVRRNTQRVSSVAIMASLRTGSWLNRLHYARHLSSEIRLTHIIGTIMTCGSSNHSNVVITSCLSQYTPSKLI